MAKAMTTNKRSTKKPQRAKRSLRSSSVKAKAPARRVANKKAVKSAAPKAGTKKAVVTLPLLKQKRLTLTLQVTPAKRKKSQRKKTKQATKTSQLSRSALTISFLMIGILGLLYCSVQVFAAPKLEPATAFVPIEITAAKPTAIKKSLAHSNAVLLQIPSISVNAPVEIVDKQADGSLQVPSEATNVGQYAQAPTPGELGPAIITGHVDTFKGPAVFWRLHEMRPGELIKIKRADGATATFKVTSVKNFSQEDFPTKQVYGNTDYAGLRLITCGGTFNYLSRHYSHNTVVFAELVK